METKTLYECCVVPAHSGFGEWTCEEYVKCESPEVSDFLAELNQSFNEVYELGIDKLPEYIEDIRGSIHHQPSKIFAAMDANGDCSYFGLKIGE